MGGGTGDGSVITRGRSATACAKSTPAAPSNTKRGYRAKIALRDFLSGSLPEALGRPLRPCLTMVTANKTKKNTTKNNHTTKNNNKKPHKVGTTIFAHSCLQSAQE